MALDTTTFSAALKDFYLPVVRGQLAEKVLIYNQFRKTAKHIDQSGKQAVLFLNTAFSTGFGSRAEGGTLPTAGNAKIVQATVPLKYNYGRIELSGQVMAASRNDSGAAIKALEFEMERMMTRILNDINRQFFSDGAGAISKVSAVGSSGSGGSGETRITVDTTKYLMAGMKLDAFSAKSGGTQRWDSISVSEIISSTTFDVADGSVGTLAANDFLFNEDTRGNDVMGLLGIIDDGDFVATLFGIDRTAANNQYWKAQEVDKGATAIDLIEDFLQDTWELVVANDGQPKFLVATYALQSKYAKLLASDKRFVNTLQLEGGFKGIEYNGVPILADKDAIANMIFFVDPSRFAIHEALKPEWVDIGGDVLRPVSGKDSYEAVLRTYMNLACDRPNLQGVLRGVK